MLQHRAKRETLEKANFEGKSATMAHAEYDGGSKCMDDGVAMNEGLLQSSADVDEGEPVEEDEPGFGLGFPGLASATLPAEDMVVPPLNFAMVSDALVLFKACIALRSRSVSMRECYSLCATFVNLSSSQDLLWNQSRHNGLRHRSDGLRLLLMQNRIPVAPIISLV